MACCDQPPRDWRAWMTPARVGAVVVAGILAAAAIAVDTDRISNLLFAAAALLFSTPFGIPLVTAMELGHPIGSVIAALLNRKQLITLRGHRLMPVLREIAFYVTRDRERATELAELAITDAAERWRGRIARELDNYMLCRAAYLAVTDELSVEGDGTVPLARRHHLATVVLRRLGVAPDDAESWLGCLEAPVVVVRYGGPAEW